MIILGIESSCDETAAAIVENGRNILASVVASQDDVHSPFGGIVPELASRQHITSILPVVTKALNKANLTMKEVEGIAVTRGPGLIGSLLVGLSTAKAIAYAHEKPIVGVHHIEGHLAAALLGPNEPKFPLIGLVVSGGHTNIYRMPKREKYELLSQTLDDAAGEAFDKVAKLLGLGFPGGPAIDRASEGGDPKKISFPRPAKHTRDFSFSGLKTAVALWVKEHGAPKGNDLKDVAASFQEAVVDSLIEKLFEAVDRAAVTHVAVCGGVAKNRRFRTKLEEETKRNDLTLWLAPMELCTDNAAMIAAAGYSRLARGEKDPLSLNAIATMPI